MSDGVFVSDNNNPRLLMSALCSTEVVLVSCRPRYRLSVGGVVVVAQRGLQDEDECLTITCKLPAALQLLSWTNVFGEKTPFLVLGIRHPPRAREWTFARHPAL